MPGMEEIRVEDCWSSSEWAFKREVRRETSTSRGWSFLWSSDLTADVMAFVNWVMSWREGPRGIANWGVWELRVCAPGTLCGGTCCTDELLLLQAGGCVARPGGGGLRKNEDTGGVRGHTGVGRGCIEGVVGAIILVDEFGGTGCERSDRRV